jgi:N-acyl-D-aspartate/D-glutamate deacylase
MLDLLIKNGTLIDGTGAASKRADVGIRNGKVVALGEVSEAATRTLDAEGAIVTPGFVDVHSHYDGQASWDGDMLPSSAHGVTTAVMGNCGVGFAPCRPADHERLIKLFEGVEDIPGSALTEGIKWEWETFGEYLDYVDARPRTMDVAAYLTHDALRVYVMGDRAVADSAATADDLRAMQAIVRDAMRSGAIGFSTGRTDNHRAIDGSHTPASEASEEELTALARAMAESGRGVLQAVSDFDMERGPERFEGEFDVLERFGAAAPGHTLWLSWMQRDLIPTQWVDIMRRAEAANARGVKMRLQAAPRGIGVLLGLQATFHPFIGFPSYKRIAHLPLAERVKEMRDPSFRARILGETSDKIADDGSPVPPLADRLLSMLDRVSMRMFPLGAVPNYEPGPGESLMARAVMSGGKPLEAIYDALLEQDGKALLYFPVFNYTGMSLDVVETMLHHPLSIPGLADGGAHCGTICDASMPTYFLMHWARDRARGRFSLEEAVKKLTGAPAEMMGFRDRGTLELGKKADLNVIDIAKLSLDSPHLVTDLPAGGRRFLQNAHGYRATVVSGAVVALNDQLTGDKPGRVVRLS